MMHAYSIQFVLLGTKCTRTRPTEISYKLVLFCCKEATSMVHNITLSQVWRFYNQHMQRKCTIMLPQYHLNVYPKINNVHKIFEISYTGTHIFHKALKFC